MKSPYDERLDAHILQLLEMKYGLPGGAIPLEMLDFLKVVKMGADKYAMNNWLEPDGHSSSHADMHDKMFHHLARSFANHNELDDESALDHLLHVACRALMQYTRRTCGIQHTADTKEGWHRRRGL